NNTSTKSQRFPLIWSKKLMFSHAISYTQIQRTRIHLPATKTSKTTRDTTQKQTRSEALPLRYIGHLNKLFSDTRKQANHTHRKPRDAITHIPKNNQPLYGRLLKRPTSSSQATGQPT
ncbi:hypothetical protein, partial [Escherichia coli]